MQISDVSLSHCLFISVSLSLCTSISFISNSQPLPNTDQLREANQALEDANRELVELCVCVSHYLFVSVPLSLVFLILNPSSTQLREANQALKELVELRALRIQLEKERDALASALKVGLVSLFVVLFNSLKSIVIC